MILPERTAWIAVPTGMAMSMANSLSGVSVGLLTLEALADRKLPSGANGGSTTISSTGALIGGPGTDDMFRRY